MKMPIPIIYPPRADRAHPLVILTRFMASGFIALSILAYFLN